MICKGSLVITRHLLLTLAGLRSWGTFTPVLRAPHLSLDHSGQMLVPGVNRTRNQNRAHKQRWMSTLSQIHIHRSRSHNMVYVFFFVFAAPVILSGGVLIEEVQGWSDVWNRLSWVRTQSNSNWTFAEFSVNYTDATKWFHITQRKKKHPIKDKHTSAHTQSIRALPSSQIWGESQQGLCQRAAKAKSQRGQAVTKSH